jgi:hypothetical protein
MPLGAGTGFVNGNFEGCLKIKNGKSENNKATKTNTLGNFNFHCEKATIIKGNIYKENLPPKGYFCVTEKRIANNMLNKINKLVLLS